MDENQAKNLILVLSKENVQEFVDVRKLINSNKFIFMCKYATDKFEKHKDVAFIRKLLYIFSFSRYYKPLLFWFCEYSGITYKAAGDLCQLKKRDAPPDKTANLMTYLTTYSGTMSDVAAAVHKKKPSASKRRVDVMDSGRVVSGSFGSGKRK